PAPGTPPRRGENNEEGTHAQSTTRTLRLNGKLRRRPLPYIRRFLAAAGLTALGALVLTGAAAVAARAHPGPARAQATAGPAQIYWATNATGTIGPATPDGTGASHSFTTATPPPRPPAGAAPGAAAAAGGHLSWANTRCGPTGRANLAGTGVDQNCSAGVGHPCGGGRPDAHLLGSRGRRPHGNHR